MIEYVLLVMKDDNTKDFGVDHSTAGVVPDHDSSSTENSSINQGTDMALVKIYNQTEASSDSNRSQEEHLQPRAADWARMLEAATQRRTEVLAPENLENMWTKGRNYKKKENKNAIRGVQEHIGKGFGLDGAVPTKDLGKEMLANKPVVSRVTKEEAIPRLTWGTSSDPQLRGGSKNETQHSEDTNKKSLIEGRHLVDGSEGNFNVASNENKSRLKRSNSTSALKIEPDSKKAFTEGGPIISEFYSPDFGRHREQFSGKSISDMVVTRVGQHIPKLRCRVSIFFWLNCDGI